MPYDVAVIRWFQTSIFPEALRLTQLLTCGLVALLFGGVVEALRWAGVLAPSPLGIPSWRWLFIFILLALLLSVLFSDAKRLRRLRTMTEPKLKIICDPKCTDCQGYAP